MEENNAEVEAQDADSTNSPPPATITLSGTVSEFTSSGYASVEAPVEKKMQWKQFFLGLFLPYAVGFGLLFLFISIQENFDPYVYEETVIEINEDGYFIHDFRHSNSMDIEYCYSNEPYNTDFYIRCSFDHSASSENQWIVQESSEDQACDFGCFVDIGTYSASNSTIWFKLTNSSIEESYIGVEFYDSEKDNSLVINVFETSFCFLPFVYVGAVIFAFVKQKKALGFGLLSALGSYLALLGALLVFLILAWM